MTYLFKLMNQKEAEAISKWTYPGRYAFYNFENDADDLAELLDQGKRGYHYYSVLKEDELIGFFTFQYNMDSRTTTIGLGMAPHMIGKGLGHKFVEEGLSLGQKTFPGTLCFRLSVAAFNKRAKITYMRCGFKTMGESMVETNGGIYRFVHMKKQLTV